MWIVLRRESRCMFVKTGRISLVSPLQCVSMEHENDTEALMGFALKQEAPVMTRTVKFRFESIPADSILRCSDARVASTVVRHQIAPGTSEHLIDIPLSWKSPTAKLMCREYYLPAASKWTLGPDTTEISVTGGDYYSDVTREDSPQQLNQADVEELIYKVVASNLSGRQTFYTALVALESYFEYLVHCMLVLSGHQSQADYDNLKTQFNRTNEAFSQANQSFFVQEIAIAPGKVVAPRNITNEIRDEVQEILHVIRRLRNDIVHGWCMVDIDRQKLKDRIDSVGENLTIYYKTDEEFYKKEAFVFTRLYARVRNSIGTRVILFAEKEIIREERENRGY